MKQKNCKEGRMRKNQHIGEAMHNRTGLVVNNIKENQGKSVSLTIVSRILLKSYKKQQ
jgi:hypothetical protein